MAAETEIKAPEVIRPSGDALRQPFPPSADSLVALLEEQVASGRLAPGAKLSSERELAAEYRVSRPVVREALRSLQERGSIEVRPSRGAYVRAARSFDVASRFGSFARQRGASAHDLIQVRGMLEELSARLAAARAGEAGVAQLLALVNAMDNAPGTIERARYDIAFHALLAKLSGNPVIEIMFGSIAPLVFEQIVRSLDDQVVTERGEPLHRVVVDAIAVGDADAAGAAMKRHVTLAEELYGDDLNVPLEALARSRVRGLGESASLDEIVEEVLSSLAAGDSYQS